MGASTHRYYLTIPEKLRLELPAWEDLALGNQRKLKSFLMELNTLTRLQRNELIECIKDCEGEMKARTLSGTLPSKAAVEAIRAVIARKPARQDLKRALATIFAYRGAWSSNKSEAEKQVERSHRESERAIAA